MALTTWRPIGGDDAPLLQAWLAAHPRDGVVFASLLREAAAHGFDLAATGVWVLEAADGLPQALVATRGVVEVFAPGREAWEALPAFVAPRLREAPALQGAAPLMGWLLAALGEGPGAVTRDTDLAVLTLSPARLVDAPEEPGFRLAGAADLLAVARQSSDMRRHELGYDPYAEEPESFLNGIAWQIINERIWVLEEAGELVYHVMLGRWTPDWGVLEGAWTPPEHRGKGYGLRGWRAASRAALTRSDRVMALTREDNVPQLRIEAATGYERAPEGQRFVVWHPPT